MTITATPGNTRFRKHQIGIQTLLNTAVPATYVEPYRGAITFNPNTTDPDVDVGSIDPALDPYRMAQNVACAKTGPLAYDPLPIRLDDHDRAATAPLLKEIEILEVLKVFLPTGNWGVGKKRRPRVEWRRVREIKPFEYGPLLVQPRMSERNHASLAFRLKVNGAAP